MRVWQRNLCLEKRYQQARIRGIGLLDPVSELVGSREPVAQEWGHFPIRTDAVEKAPGVQTARCHGISYCIHRHLAQRRQHVATMSGITQWDDWQNRTTRASDTVGPQKPIELEWREVEQPRQRVQIRTNS